MKQRIRVVGIVRNEEGVLLMKRRRNRSESPIFWELPTGKIEFGEQPEEALSRTFFDFLGVQVKSVKLKDVVTFLALAGSSQLSNLYIVYDVVIAEQEKIQPEERYSAYKYWRDLSGAKLEDASLAVLQIEDGRASGQKSDFREVANGATIFVDGCSRGNPGPSGVGYYVVDENGREIKRGGEFVGFGTARMAEYYALKEGCEVALELGLKSVRFVSDSLMMVNQMNGIYQVKNGDVLPIYKEIKGLLENFEACAFVHVKRIQNQEADAEANKAVDRHFSGDVLK